MAAGTSLPPSLGVQGLLLWQKGLKYEYEAGAWLRGETAGVPSPFSCASPAFVSTSSLLERHSAAATVAEAKIGCSELHELRRDRGLSQI